MSDPNQIRINELARELEIKAKVLIEYLPEIGVAEKKTHSSSLDVEHAELVRKHFQELAAQEAAAEAAKEAAKRGARPGATAARPAAPPVTAKPAASTPAPPTRPTAPGASPVSRPPATPQPPSTVPSQPAGSARSVAPAAPAAQHPAASTAARPSAPAPAAQKPATPARPATPGAPPLQPAGSVAQRPAAASAVPRPATPGAPRPAGSPAAQRPAPRPEGAPPRPGQPRPGAPIGMRPAAAGVGAQRPRPEGQRPGAPPSRFPQRPGGPRPGGPGGQRPGGPGLGGIPKAEPGKPLYARKPPAPARNRPLIEKRFAEGERKLHPVRTRPGVGPGGKSTQIEPVAPVQREPRLVTVTEGITIRELAEKLDIRAKDLLKTLLDRGVFGSINQALDVQSATSLAEAFNGIVQVVSFEEEMAQEEKVAEQRSGNLQPRAPVVTVMGHVDHGKTSLLDAIRETEVAAGEAGGITQHIGAYEAHVDERRIVFIDTPGHEAFTRMRARGAKVTDIVVLVVGADDGVMPQTEEAISHAKAANVKIIVAINKIDKPEAQPERVKRQLADRGLMPEEWGGDTVMVEVSARTKKNIPRLLEMILLVADLAELKADPDAPASGTVLESRVDKGRGPVATVLVQNGTLRVGDFFIVGSVYGKVRAMFDDRAQAIKKAIPSTPVEVLGLQGVPEAGDQFQVADEARARHIAEYRQSKQREASLAKTASSGRLTLDQLHEQLKAGEVKELAIVVKADVQGSVEVLTEMLPKLSNDEVKLKVIQAGVGAVTETDVLLASASNAIIVAFNVRPERKAADLAQRENVDIRLHTIIYELLDELKKAVAGLLAPVIKETYMGRAEVRDTFRVKGAGMIAGCSVQDGIIKRDADVRVLRDNIVIYTGRVISLRRFKDDVNEVRSGFECGVGISNFNDVKVGDVLECFKVEKTAPVEAAMVDRGRAPETAEARRS
ncbi:MAG TPA: translation initiation factor IF-2 [Candidatus Acidoferrales bacterium]|nr:translation initiation factor IF-2 [Candidatus Acidoferrales bacterium]